MPGAGTSQWRIAFAAGKATFDELTPGQHTVCAVPLPVEIQGMAAMGYFERHGDTLPAFCKAVEVAAAPATQALSLPVPAPITEP